MKAAFVLLALASLTASVHAQTGTLFVGQEGKIATRETNLGSFPSVSYTDGMVFDVQGAAATPESLIFLANGSFSTNLYVMVPGGAPVLVMQSSVAFQGLGYTGGKLYGFANFASPMGIYEIDIASGTSKLVVDTSKSGLRFFALDGNPADGLLYGFSEYGVSGLYSINPKTGETHRIAPTPPGSYGMCRGMAVGNNTVYMVATHPTDTHYAYDLELGDNGTYVPFEQAFEESRNGGGAWYDPSITPPPPANDNCDTPTPVGDGVHPFANLTATTDAYPWCGGDNDVWFLYTPTEDKYAMFSTCGLAAFDTMITLYSDCNTELVCVDDACGRQTSVGYNVKANVPILVRVSSWDAFESGFGSLSIGDCMPATITSHPQSVSLCASNSPYVIFNSDGVASGELSYSWERNGKPVMNGTTESGSTVIGATSNRLLIISPTAADAGDYRLVITSSCESETTAASDVATLTICAADFNCANGVNSQDFFDFLNAFFDASPTADFNADGSVNSQDFFDFLNAFFAGC